MLIHGQWRAAELTPNLTRVGADPDLDDATWPEVSVPGHWVTTEEFKNSSGPILYRTQFAHEAPDPGRRAWLRFDGVMGQSDVWLDGSYLGSTAGYFAPRQFEITDLLREGNDHSLSIEVDCPEPNVASKRVLTGSLQSGPLSPDGHPGGIWQPVSVNTTGPIVIHHSRLICSKATQHEAELSLRLVLDAASAGDVRVDTSIAGPDGIMAGGGSEVHTVAKGENRLEWTVTIENPKLWWPVGLGEQPMYEVGVSLREADNQTEVSDRKHWRVGLRRIRVDRMQWWVNGQRFFAKGIVLGPQSPRLAEVDSAACRADLEAAKGAGLNLVRVFGHVAPPELYDIADELGMLIWQDLPLVGEYSTSVRKPAKRLARTIVDQLGHHPSVALWCAHTEPNGPPLPEPAASGDVAPPVARRLGRHLLPSWNRSLLDPQLRRELHAADKSRTALTHSGGLPGVTEIGSADPHLWLGWHVGLAEDLAGLLKKWPRLGTFLSGFGSQSLPIDDWPMSAPSFKNAQLGPFQHYLPRRAYADGQSWAAASQAYQADLLRIQIETVRRLKYRPTGGFCLTALADAEPDGGFGILHFDRTPKVALNSVLDACRPVIVIADMPPQLVAPGDHLELDIHAVSDLPIGLGDVVVKAEAHLGDWTFSKEWAGDLSPDSCSFIGTLALTVPQVNGALIIDIHLVAESVAATNRYQTVVIPASEADVKEGTRLLR